MKNILILGAARSGKSTLTKMLADKLGFSIVSIDAFISAFQDVYPAMGFAHHLSENKHIAPFVASYVNAIIYNHPKSKFIVEGFHITLSDAIKLFGDNFEIVVLGYPQLKPQEVLENVRKYEGKFDYTRALTDDKLLSMVSRHVEYSKQFEKESQELLLSFYDTSYNRDEVLNDIICRFVSDNSKKQHLNENIIGENIKLARPLFNRDTAQKIFSVIDKCRNVFLPWLGWVENTNNIEDSLHFLEQVEQDWKNNNQFVYEISFDNKFIGLISVINISWQHKRAEIGYWLDTDYTGKGYMSQAVLLIEKELFEKNFNKIIIHTDVLNVKSAAIPKRLGYKLEGILRQDIYSESNKRYRDRNVFSKLKSDTDK